LNGENGDVAKWRWALRGLVIQWINHSLIGYRTL
jgi:hypothetical protein